MNAKRGVAILSYNRGKNLRQVVESIASTVPADTRVVVCDDGSTDGGLASIADLPVSVLRGPNMGVGANKNRALWLLQDCNFIAMVEDDLVAAAQGWFELYEQAAMYTGIHHFCRVQGPKQGGEAVPKFMHDMKAHGVTPIYGIKPRGDFVFITKAVVDKVGAFHPDFQGAGYAHVQWQDRIWRAGLIPHPNKWIDLRGEGGQDPFEQLGDTEGGRWDEKEKVELQIRRNRKVYDRVQAEGTIHVPLFLP